MPSIKSLRDLFEWPQQEFYRVQELAVHYVGHFHEYLLRGGFPQTAQVESINQAQRLLREDIIDKVLKRYDSTFWCSSNFRARTNISLFLVY